MTRKSIGVLLVPLALVGLVAAKNTFKQWVQEEIMLLWEAVGTIRVILETGPNPGELVVMSDDGQELGPAFSLDGGVRVVMDPGIGKLLAFDIYGHTDPDWPEVLVPVNSRIGAIKWTGPGCTGTPLAEYEQQESDMLPRQVAVTSVPSGIYEVVGELPDIVPVSVEVPGYGCQELELPHVPVPGRLAVARIGNYLNDTYQAPFTITVK